MAERTSGSEPEYLDSPQTRSDGLAVTRAECESETSRPFRVMLGSTLPALESCAEVSSIKEQSSIVPHEMAFPQSDRHLR